jgi:hypothetical protein
LAIELLYQVQIYGDITALFAGIGLAVFKIGANIKTEHAPLTN